MKTLKAILARIAAWFRSGRAEAALNAVADLVPHAVPIIDIAATIVTTLTPGKLDDAGWAAVKAAFPALFDGSLKTGAEVKMYALGIATELLKRKFPGTSTSVARAAVQLAYTGERAR